jgi:hypothetical protein
VLHFENERFTFKTNFDMEKKIDKTTEPQHDAKLPVISSFLSGHSYFAKHLPTGEDWYLLGIDVKGDRVCVAGWPPTIGKLSDCENIVVNKPLTEEELAYRSRSFGLNWL